MWATLQLTWTFVLLASQYWQIARQMTTLEVSNLGRYGFMGGRGGASLSGQMGHRHQRAAEEAEDTGGLAEGTVHAHHRHASGKAVDGLARAGKAANPFDLGLVGNCKDFWTGGQELGVEYERLYDVPIEGFQEAKRRREMEDLDDGRSIGGSRKSVRKGLLMGLGLGRGGSSRAGYEPVSQV
ncbi:hypothetical protein JAAARDRAFT_317397 [Jaapia argillacea MUCL 33604]|uniref:Uncharacterized protein n=1 Tax=Jaapia argillacea MUCL 33604 TaxID=933084 RepID=A0A067PMH2_9AGAM|nr:hypothetical protein JAAARDRAFT_317397 [Jaapia argillacea MUCL 33604]